MYQFELGRIQLPLMDGPSVKCVTIKKLILLLIGLQSIGTNDFSRKSTKRKV